jgi:hypothetical protein
VRRGCDVTDQERAFPRTQLATTFMACLEQRDVPSRIDIEYHRSSERPEESRNQSSRRGAANSKVSSDTGHGLQMCRYMSETRCSV